MNAGARVEDRHPEQTTSDRDELVAALALLDRVSSSAPRRRGSYSHSALVPWNTIGEVREFLIARTLPPSSVVAR